MASLPTIKSHPGVQNALLERAFSAHVKSFDFALGEGLTRAISNLDQVYTEFDEGDSITIWIESAQIGPPCLKTVDNLIFPRDSRLSSTTYAAPMTLTIGVQYCKYESVSHDDSRSECGKLLYQSPPVFINKSAGRVPIMIRSKFCNLQKKINQLIDKKLKNYGGRKLKITSNESKESALEVRNILRKYGEDETEQGGYWIINGNEKVCRLLITQKSNYPIALSRSHYAQSGPNFSHHTISLRCLEADQCSQTNTLHYLNSGDATMRFNVNRQNFFLPAVLLLKSWKQTTDREIYQLIIQGDSENTFVTDRVESMLRLWQTSDVGRRLNTREECLSHIGSLFRINISVSRRSTDLEAGEFVLKKYLLTHLSSDDEKFYMLIYMIQKLYAIASGQIKSEDVDSPSNQDILLPGQLYLMLMKERMRGLLTNIRIIFLKDYQAKTKKFNLQSEAYYRHVVDKCGEIGSKMEFFLATGNLISNSGLDQKQSTGFTIVADRLNYIRFFSHFQAVHRGQFFTQVRTTEVRKLNPSGWGFFCPVHTPDGAPCGLLNHLAAPASISTGENENLINRHNAIQRVLSRFGALDYISSLSADHLKILLDGKVVGSVLISQAEDLERILRSLKVRSGIFDRNSDVNLWIESNIGLIEQEFLDKLRNSDPFLAKFESINECAVPWDLEICLVKPEMSIYPSLYLFSGPTRLRRPVYNIQFGLIEMIGPYEQNMLFIDCPDQNSRVQQYITEQYMKDKSIKSVLGVSPESILISPKGYTHREIDPTYIFSHVGSLTPFSEYNQSPRNMYQCQMAKQTMGTPLHSFIYRNDNKIFSLTTPQIPLVRTNEQVLFDSHPNGTNAVVAVLSYTGYDMEDAMIINKFSSECGWGCGMIYKTEVLNITQEETKKDSVEYFNNIRSSPKEGNPELVEPSLDQDGLPYVGQTFNRGDPFYVIYNELEDKHQIHYNKNSEKFVVEQVVITGINSNPTRETLTYIQRVILKIRILRKGVRGDKFSSRHGQKGVLSQLWQFVDMPFCENGITPDIIINPNAFPSRMTIGMLIESMAGKAAALGSNAMDATPFGYNEKYTAVDYFGKELLKHGYNYFGNEIMYSGLTGEPFHADIFLGIVHYQRLRHMVGDKYQVRTSGIRNRLTNQPVKGRKKGGGIRFGEMERDSLLAHGVSFMLHDRLFNCSDRSKCYACKFCGSIISAIPDRYKDEEAFESYLHNSAMMEALGIKSQDLPYKCKMCDSTKGVVLIEIPFVFRYLIAELASMNVRLSLDIK